MANRKPVGADPFWRGFAEELGKQALVLPRMKGKVIPLELAKRLVMEARWVPSSSKDTAVTAREFLGLVKKRRAGTTKILRRPVTT